MRSIFSGGLIFSPPYKKNDSRFTARALSIIVWLLGLTLIGFAGLTIQWASIDWLAAETWLKIAASFLGVGFLLMPIVLLWAVGRIVRHRSKQRYGWPIAIFGVLTSVVALAIWFWLIFEGIRHKYV